MKSLSQQLGLSDRTACNVDDLVSQGMMDERAILRAAVEAGLPRLLSGEVNPFTLWEPPGEVPANVTRMEPASGF